MKKMILFTRIVLILISGSIKAQTLYEFNENNTIQSPECTIVNNNIQEAKRLLKKATRAENIDEMNSYLKKARIRLITAESNMFNCNDFNTKLNIQNSLHNIRRSLNEDNYEEKTRYARKAKNNIQNTTIFIGK